MQTHSQLSPRIIVALSTLIAFLVLAPIAASQSTGLLDTTSVFYPLAVGDYWEFYDRADLTRQIVDTVSWFVSGDTTIGTRRYKIIRCRSFRYNLRWSLTQRIDSLGNVYTPSGNSESLTYRLSDTTRTFWMNGGNYARWEQNYQANIYGASRRVLMAVTYRGSDTTRPGSAVVLAERIGIIGMPTLELGGYELRGARIAGQVIGTITSVERNEGETSPTAYELKQNYPNPFNPSTTIAYQLPTRGHVVLRLIDLLGREVAVLVNETQPAGSYRTEWNANGFASGVYYYQINAGGFVQTKKLVVLR